VRRIQIKMRPTSWILKLCQFDGTEDFTALAYLDAEVEDDLKFLLPIARLFVRRVNVKVFFGRQRKVNKRFNAKPSLH